MLPFAALITTLVSAHPDLYYEPAGVPTYQAASSTTHLEIANTLFTGALSLQGVSPSSLSFVPDRGSALVPLSVSCMLSADPKVCQTAHQWLTEEMASVDPSGAWETPSDFIQSNYLLGFAIAYDILSDARLPSALSAAEKSQLQALIAAGCGYFYSESVNGQLWYSPDWSQNHNWSAYGSFGVAALSILGEVPAAQTWLTHAVVDYDNVQRVLNRIIDGTWHEGYSYESGSVAAWLWFAAAVHHAKAAGRLSAAVQDYTQTPWLEAFGHYRAVASLPGRTYQSILFHGDFFGWAGDEAVMSLRYIASRFRQSDAAWLAQSQLVDLPHGRYAPEQTSIALEYLVYDPSVPATQPPTLDLGLGDLAGRISRSGYDAQASVLAVKAGAFGGLGNWQAIASGLPPGGELDFGHDHVDDLGFWLYANGEWLAPEAAGYVEHPTPNPSYPLCYDTRFHNTITVDGTGQLGDDGWANESTESAQIDFSRVGSVPIAIALPGLSYIEMEGAHLYPSSLGLNLVRRQVLFVDRNEVAVRDQLQASVAHGFEWNSHAMNGAVQEGNWIQAIGLNDHSLAVRVIAPAAWTFSTEAQITQQILDSFDPSGTMTRFVLTTPPVTATRFLVVMEPTASSQWASRPDIAPFDASGQANGFLLADGSQWITGDSPSAVTAAANLELSGTVGCVRPGASESRYTLIRASRLTQGGAELISADAVDGAVDVRTSAGRMDVQSTGVSRIHLRAPLPSTSTWNGATIAASLDPSDSHYIFIPAVGTSAPDAGITTSSPDAGAGPSTGGSPGAGDGGGGRPGIPVRGHCGATGVGPLVGCLIVAAAAGAQRSRKRRDGR